METSEKIAAYLRRITAVRPNLRIEEVTANDEGLINEILIVNGREVFRFPKNDWAVQDMWQEAKCLELARETVDLRLPLWTIYEGDEQNYPFVSYEFIPGEALRREQILRLPDRDQQALADQIGMFLHQMHAVPLTELARRGIGLSATKRTAEKWLNLYDDVQAELFPMLMQFARDWVDDHFEPLLTDPTWMDGPQTFMNGDLGVYHLLYDAHERRLKGILDFGTAGIGDPAADFGCLIDQYGETFVQRLSRTYPGMELLMDRARFWAGTMPLQWVLAGLRDPADPSWFLVHIGRARDVRPIGNGGTAI